MNECLQKTVYNCLKFSTIIVEQIKLTYNLFLPYIDPSISYFKDINNKRVNSNINNSLKKYNKKCFVVNKDNVCNMFIKDINEDFDTTNNVCDFSFESINVIINSDKSYEFLLRNERNFYNVSNKFDLNFVRWYLDYYHNEIYDEKYSIMLNIIDHKCDIVTVDLQKNYIVLKKESYEII